MQVVNGGEASNAVETYEGMLRVSEEGEEGQALLKKLHLVQILRVVFAGPRDEDQVGGKDRTNVDLKDGGAPRMVF